MNISTITEHPAFVAVTATDVASLRTESFKPVQNNDLSRENFYDVMSIFEQKPNKLIWNNQTTCRFGEHTFSFYVDLIKNYKKNI